MKIDPNSALMGQECVFIEGGQIVLHDDRITPAEQLDQRHSPFQEFLSQIDPNRHFVAAFIPEDRDRDLFYQARKVARGRGIHMQATVDPPDEQRRRWQRYQTLKQRTTVAAPIQPEDAP